MLNKARIAVLVSGGGTNLEALLNAQEAGALPHGEIVLVLSSNPEAYALERAKRRGVPAIPLSRKQLGQEPFEAVMEQAEWVLLPQAAEQLAAHIATEKEEHL